MGNTCSASKRKRIPGKENAPLDEPTTTETEVMQQFYGTELHFLPYQERRAQLEEWLADIQEHNRERLRKEMLTDLHTFILNNVLLCVQFYGNFDSSLNAAKKFKESTEMKMNEKLVPLADDGMILGERKCTLVHGMGQQLVKNYIYRDDGYLHKKKYSTNENEGRKRHVTIAVVPDKEIGEFDEPRSTFTCDSILPLEFVITWENLEVYKESEWFDLQENEYTSAKGSQKICRVCLEETDDKNKIPRGFVRIRVADTPLSLRPIHPLPISKNQDSPVQDSLSASESVGYAAGSFSTTPGTEENEFQEIVQEVQTESDLSPTSESDDSDAGGTSDLSIAFRNGTDFMNNLKNHIEGTGVVTPQKPRLKMGKFIHRDSFQISGFVPSPEKMSHQIATKIATPAPAVRELYPRKAIVEIVENSTRLGGVIPQRYQNVVTELSHRQLIPKVTVSIPSSPPKESSKPERPKRVENKAEKTNVQDPPKLGALAPSSALHIRRKSKSLPSVAPPIPPKIEKNMLQGSSSGLDAMPQTLLNAVPVVTPRSDTTSNTSDDIHHKWRQVELKRLWQFLPKRRQNAAEPLSTSCFQKIQIEVESDEEDQLEIDTDESDSMSDETDSDISSSSTNGKPRDLGEPKYEDRTYLNSVGFSADFCSEFKQLGAQLDIDEGPIRSAVILGTTIRCVVTQDVDNDAQKPWPSSTQNGVLHKRQSKGKSSDLTSKLYTFTPSLHSKNWPQKPLIWWKGRMLRDDWDGTEKWPTREQIEQIEEEGCNIIPLGNRSINSTQSENVQQTLVWSVGFPRAETILLNSLLHVQWRCLTFSALLFRAFVAPLGPLGIGLEHFRNILYFMCHEEFVSWNYEQPGQHLKALLDRIYDCLGRGDMPSFFVVGHNLLKNIPDQNLRKVQAYLSKVRNNLLFYTIFMVRNLVQVNNDFYPMPKDNFKKLYDYMTLPEKHILYLVNPLLAGITTEDLKKDASEKKRKKREKKEINQALLMNGELIDNAYGNVVNKGFPKLRPVDHEQRKLKRKRERWIEKQQKIKAYEEEEARIAAEEAKLPQEKKNSIDLDAKPLKQRDFSRQRLGLILKYFIKHFIKMAAKSYQFETYAQASMYTQHVENLISLLCELPNEAESEETEKFKEDAKFLRSKIGSHMIDYIQEKISHVGNATDIGSTSKAFDHITGLLTNPGENTGIFSNNWDLRTLPTPPIQQITASPYESLRTGAGISKYESLRTGTGSSKHLSLDRMNMAKSLASLSTTSLNREDGPTHSAGELHIPRVPTKNYRRSPEIKWKSNPSFTQSASNTPPRIRSEVESDNVTFGAPIQGEY